MRLDVMKQIRRAYCTVQAGSGAGGAIAPGPSTVSQSAPSMLYGSPPQQRAKREKDNSYSY